MLPLYAQIESILFLRTEGVTISFLAKVLEVSPLEIKNAVAILQQETQDRGIRLLVSGETVLLTTHPSMSKVVEKLLNEQTVGELTPASLQTLSIILYMGSASRGQISYIRGVDARMSLRNLSMRGLIEKAEKDSYRATADALRYLGVNSNEQLPRYSDIREALSKELHADKE